MVSSPGTHRGNSSGVIRLLIRSLPYHAVPCYPLWKHQDFWGGRDGRGRTDHNLAAEAPTTPKILILPSWPRQIVISGRGAEIQSAQRGLNHRSQ